MDKVRFGRALGYGARHAAKSLRAAAQAANTPSPRPPSAEASPSRSAAPPNPIPRPAAEPRVSAQQALRVGAQLHAAKREAGRQARRSFLGPLAKFSSVVSLQVTGTFFALLALIMAQAAWRSRATLHASPSGAGRFYIVAAVGLLFGYFAISNFVRARRRDNE